MGTGYLIKVEDLRFAYPGSDAEALRRLTRLGGTSLAKSSLAAFSPTPASFDSRVRSAAGSLGVPALDV
jgi:hypothetical protein